MSDLSTVLESFCNLEGVRGALIVAPDGQIVDKVLTRAADVLAIARVVTEGVRLGEQTSAAFALEGLTQSYMEYGNLSVTSEVLVSGSSLVVLADPKPNLGRIRLEIRKNRKIIEGLGT